MTLKSRLETLVTVFGGSGFLGRHVVRALANRGYRIRVAVRRPELAGHLQPIGRVGQIHAVQANLRYPDSVKAAVRDADIVINLVGILFERGRQRFDAVMAAGAEAVARAASAVGAPLVHVSAIGADADARSQYAKAKAQGERLVLAAQSAAVIVRPSIVFGPEDDFFNRFAALARIAPALPLVGGGRTRMQPVFAGDVAEAIAKRSTGRRWRLKAGHDLRARRSGRAHVQGIDGIRARHHRAPPPAGPGAVRADEAAGDGPAIPAEAADHARSGRAAQARQCRLRRRPSATAARWKALGIMPESIDAIVPTYLWRFRKTGQFNPHTA